MKKFLIFLIGFVLGIFTCLFVVTCSSLLLEYDRDEDSVVEEVKEAEDQSPQITIFDEPRECISTRPFQVSEVWENGYAIAVEHSGIGSIYDGQKVLFVSDMDDAFYDKQIIAVPKGKCVKQIGICRYKEKYYSDLKTIPVVKLLDE